MYKYIEGIKAPIKAWVEGVEVEEQAMEQLMNMSSLPFVFSHLAVMPDVHLGKGATVGSVIATKGAIVPASVGVDIGCFVGETKIPLLDGTQKTLKELTLEKELFWVYSINKDGKIVPGLAKAVCTRKNANLMSVMVSGGEEILCTPDHQFMLKDCTYKEAKYLSEGEELKTFAGLSIATHLVEQLHHRVFKITDLDYTADVYCLQVEEHHNFALSAGVFVHNCGMMAQQTTLKANDLPDNLFDIRVEIERAIPHGFTTIQGRSKKGNWEIAPNLILSNWSKLNEQYDRLVEKHPQIKHEQPHNQLGSLGGGNHFIELCLDESDNVWVMLHSGSRGAGNKIGTYFIEKAKKEMERMSIHLPDKDLAYLAEGSTMFDDYWEALAWAQEYAKVNRDMMMNITLRVLHEKLPPFQLGKVAVNCHHNYVSRENHFNTNVMVTRKGAVSARVGQLGIIPGSMGAKSFIVRGKGNADSFCSCSHGAGRKMSRNAAKNAFTVDDQIKATAGVECRKDESVIDEIPHAYKDIDAVMHAQQDLVEIVHTLKQVLCVKG